MSDYLAQILAHSDLFISGLVGVCIVGGVILEASPIPINPLKWLGNHLNQDLKKDINALDERLDKIEKDNLNRDLQTKRAMVLSFADTLRRTDDDKLGVELCTLEEFENIIDVMDEYHELIKKHNIPNGKFDIARNYIIDVFTYLSKNGRFVDKK